MTEFTASKFITISGTYGYWTTIALATGRKFTINVRKTESPNPSARGGAYRTQWVARAQGRKVYADTRKGAVEAAAASLAERFPN